MNTDSELLNFLQNLNPVKRKIMKSLNVVSVSLKQTMAWNLRTKLDIASAEICTQEVGMQDAETVKLQRVTL